MKEKLHNLNEGIKELESMINEARLQGKPTAGNEILLQHLYIMKCELMDRMESASENDPQPGELIVLH